MLVNYVQIKPCSTGFGLYQAIREPQDPVDDADFLNEVDSDVALLRDGDIPEWAEDIRGLVHDEPDRIYACLPPGGSVFYFGFDAAELDREYVFLVEAIPTGDFDWLKIWEGDCNLICSGEDPETGPFEYSEPGQSSLSVKRETDEDGPRLSLWIPNNAKTPEGLQSAILEKFGIDMYGGDWGTDGEAGRHCSFLEDS